MARHRGRHISPTRSVTSQRSASKRSQPPSPVLSPPSEVRVAVAAIWFSAAVISLQALEQQAYDKLLFSVVGASVFTIVAYGTFLFVEWLRDYLANK